MNSTLLSVVQVALVHQVNDMTGPQHYIGSKIILAEPMTRQEYNHYRGWTLPENEDGTDEGYLVEYPDGVSNHPNHGGYVSWSPKGQFDMAYLALGNVQKYKPHERRVVGELVQLQQKLTALQKFCKEDRFLKLPFKVRDLMQEQCRVMTRYAMILEERIAAFA